MKSFTDFIKESLTDIQYKKFRDAINEYFQTLFDNAEDKNEFIELLRMQADSLSEADLHDFLEEFTEKNPEFKFDKIKNDDEIEMIVKEVAQEWLDDIE